MSRMICDPVAPSARRIPSSRVRSLTELAISPWIPIAASSSATAPSPRTSVIMNRWSASDADCTSVMLSILAMGSIGSTAPIERRRPSTTGATGPDVRTTQAGENQVWTSLRKLPLTCDAGM